MKKLLLIFAVLFYIGAEASPIDTLKIDTVKNALLVQPAVINALKKDTCFQITWNAGNISRSDSSTATLYYQLYDRKGRQIYQENLIVPASVVAVWLSNTVIDDYILSFLGLKRR